MVGPHIMVLPCPTQGHINGMMNFAKYLASSPNNNFVITFVHSARNYERLKLSSPAEETPPPSQLLRIEVLPDGLPAFDDIAGLLHKDLTVPEYLASLRAIVEGLPSLLTKLQQQGRPVTCLVCDTLLPGTQSVADLFAIPRVDFWTSTAACFYSCLSLPHLISHGFLPVPDAPDIEAHMEETIVDIIPGIPPFRLTELTTQILCKDRSVAWIPFMLECFAQVQNADRIFIHTFYDVESHALDAMRKGLGLPVYPVGPLFAVDGVGSRETSQGAGVSSLLHEDDGCMEWLDQQADASVIYVSFGSCDTISTPEIHELALGLEASAQPFLLVLRPGSHAGISLEDALPQGYASRVGERGMVTCWAPQRAVLAHAAVGGFMTHCGWNSTLEGMWMGVPLLGCPRGSEQRSNVRYIAEEWRNGMRLERKKGRGGLIHKEAVESGVRRLMHSDEGLQVRQRAAELKFKARQAMELGGSSRMHLDQFIKDMTLSTVKGSCASA